MRAVLLEKFKESLLAVLPISIIILILHFTIAPLSERELAILSIGMIMLFIGMILFSVGVELALLPIGEHVGSALISSRKPVLIFTVLFIFGFIVTAAEPDISVLANQVASIPNTQLIIGISLGVGVFLCIAVLRILMHWRLGRVLAVIYPLAFIVAILFSQEYISLAIDAAAVTTGPVTVPFLLAIGGGFAAATGGKDAEENNFGISAICSVGPIIMVLILGMFYDPTSTQYLTQPDVSSKGANQLVAFFANGLWHSFVEVIIIIVPIVAIFLLFQVVKLKLSHSELHKIFIGIIYLVVGLAIFLAGVNNGFLPAATALGEAIGNLSFNWIAIPIAFVIGACVLLAEPTAYVLVKRVEEITDGAIPKFMMLFGMTTGVGIAMALAMFRLLFGISIWWVLIPGYFISLTLTFIVPEIFVGIGFDAGEVATGAMSAAFVLPFAVGVGSQIPGVNIIAESFGIVGLSTMLPPIIVQIMGLIYSIKLRKSRTIDLSVSEQSAKEIE